jgi:hypothetical protein
VDPDAIPNSERLNPAAPSRVTAAALVVRFFLEACLTRRMVASSLLVNALGVASLRSAKGARKYLPPCHKMKWNLGKRAESRRLRTVLSSLRLHNSFVYLDFYDRRIAVPRRSLSCYATPVGQLLEHRGVFVQTTNEPTA